METGELKTLVIQSLRKLKEASVTDIISYIQRYHDREYAYSTIATVLSRLEDDQMIVSEKKRKIKRKKTYFRLQEDAHEEEASVFLKEYISKFGDVGIRHLGEVMGAEITQEELENLRNKIMTVK